MANILSSEGLITTQDEVRLFFQKLGSGPDAVIIPNAVHMFDSFRQLAGHRTVIFFDLRNRGGSDAVRDSAKLARGIHHDVDDIEAVRQHFGFDRITVIGHSYQALVVFLYALKYPDRVSRIVQIGPMPPQAGTLYPEHLTGQDATLAGFVTKLAQLQQEPRPADPREAGRKFWDLLRVLMVANPVDAGKIQWKPYDHPNELMFMRHWTENLFPSIQNLNLAAEDLTMVTTPVLVIHGTRDRQSPYGAGREWSLKLPNARLLTVENAAHVPWIEAPDLVLGGIELFLEGEWPTAAAKVDSLDPLREPDAES